MPADFVPGVMTIPLCFSMMAQEFASPFDSDIGRGASRLEACRVPESC